MSHRYRSDIAAMRLCNVVYLGGQLSDRPELASIVARHVAPNAKPAWKRKYSPAQKRRRQEKFEQWLERTGRISP